MIAVTVCCDDGEDRRLTVDPGQPIHVAIAEAFGCELQKQAHRVLFGDTDVFEGESFEDYGIEVSGRTRRTVCCLSVLSLTVMRVCVWPPGWCEAQHEHQDADGDCQGSGRRDGSVQSRRA